MLRSTCLLAMTALCALLVFAGTVGAGAKFNKVLDIGSQAPGISGVGVDDKPYSLDAAKDAKAVVVIFTCNHCPVAMAYEDRFIKLAQEYKDQGVSVVAVNVNNSEADKLDKMKERAEEKGFTFPYVYDSSQQSARKFGASVTPQVFVLDKDRKVAYMGAFDDSMFASKVEQQFCRDAVNAVLEGKSVEVPETRAKGCGIQYED